MSLHRLQGLDLELHICADIITPVDVVRDLDTKLTMKKYICKIRSICFYHMRHLKQVRRLLSPDITASRVSAFVLSRLDYCNSVLVGLPQLSITPLQEYKMQKKQG